MNEFNDDWQLHVRREYHGANPRFDFPVRPLGVAGKVVGIVVMAFGVAFVWSPGGEWYRALRNWVQGGFDATDVAEVLFQLPFLLMGCIPLVIGLLILFGRSRVEWRDGALRVAELIGPLRWTRRMPRKPVRKLEVAATVGRTAGAPPKSFSRFSALAAEFEDGSKKVVVLGYPKEWLLAVAQELQSYVGGEAFENKVEVKLADPLDLDPALNDVLEQPAGSRVQLEERGASLRVWVPPQGVWRGSNGLFLFGLLWCGFLAAITIGIASAEKNPRGLPLVFWLIIPAFWAVGIGMMLGAIKMGRRSALLEVNFNSLSVEARGAFGVKKYLWTRGDLAAIRADATNMEVNNKPVVELQIHPRMGKKVGLLGGRGEKELQWLATRLRRALDVPALDPQLAGGGLRPTPR